ncbi:efflux RND transporter periplasmic adaptor subunit [Pseudoruegeria sp. HB172150]|uniref:efflux RND transporter periplasmic adaptor subunit n=1 Tax=Pseudoruegeria sp. HB172150 TaxID=2721164 RepID=UPI001C131C03|nr:efflux RND transporter periplasmic adaptor subunit [Pseudoruegeria sp. HB172150]
MLFILPLAAQAQGVLPVEIVTAEKSSSEDAFSIVGTVEASESYPAAFRTGGRITEVNVEVGDHISEGTVIAKVEADMANASLDAARASLQAATAAVDQARLARDRASGLLERGAGTQADLDEAEEAYLSAVSSRDRAQASLEQAEQAVEDTVLRASSDVVVIDRSADPGEIVSAGQEVVSLAVEGLREALFQAPDVFGLAKARGKPIRLSTPAQGDIDAEVTEVSDVLTDAGTVEVRAAIPPEFGRNLPFGTQIVGTVVLASAPIVTVPSDALTASATGPAVWTVDPDTMRVDMTPIVLAGFGDEALRIEDGVEEGALVVGAGSHLLFPGQAVRPVEMAE